MAPSMAGSDADLFSLSQAPHLLNSLRQAGAHDHMAWVQEGALIAGKNFPRVPSLVFDIELGEEARTQRTAEDDAPIKELRRWLLPGSTGEFKLRNDVATALGSQMQQAPPSSALEGNQRLAASLGRLGYHVAIRTALGGGDGFECLRNLRHVFLTVLPPGAHATTNRFVVDLSFKEQLSIAKPTQRYQALLDCLPDVYVAPEASVAPLVNFMCQEMANAFRSTGAVLPPWRQAHAMLSKWLPRKSLDEQVVVTRSHVPLAGGAATAGFIPSAKATHPQLARRSIDTQPSMAVHGHWVQPAAHAQGRASHRTSLDEPQQQQAPANTGLTSRKSSIKPIALEPQRVVVGGNFASIGFP